MNIKSFIKNNKLFFTISIFVLAWIVFLIVLLFTQTREVIFYDYLADENVSSDYSVNFPLMRYLIEPIIGITYYLLIEGEYWGIAILLIYLISRALYLIFKKKNIIHSEKFENLVYLLRDFMRFASIVGLLFILTLIPIIGIGYWLRGNMVVSGLMYVLDIAVILIVLALLTKFIIILIKLLHPVIRFNYLERIARKREWPKAIKILKREFTYLFGFFVLLLTSHVFLYTTLLPTYEIVPDDLDNDEILIDLHVHTLESDGWLTPEERVNWYIAEGIQAAAFSDHHSTEGAIKAKEYVKQNNLDFTVIIAQEYTTNIHMNIYGLKKIIVPMEYETENGPEAMEVKDVIKYVKDHDGYITVNHYGRKDDVPYTYEELRDWGVDGFEIINGGGRQAEEIKDFCLNNSLICMAGSDQHLNSDLNTFIKLKLNDKDDLSVDSIFESLKNNTHETILIEMNPEIIQFQGFFGNFHELERFLNYLFNLDTYQYLSWIIWSSGVFAIFAFIYKKLKDLDLEKCKYKIC